MSKHIGKNIREERIKQNISLTEFSNKVNIAKSFYGEIERLDKTPSCISFLKIVNELKVPADLLLRYNLEFAKPYVISQITNSIDKLPEEKKIIIGNLVKSLESDFLEINKKENN